MPEKTSIIDRVSDNETRKGNPQRQHANTHAGKNGYCPKCGSDQLAKNGRSTNVGNIKQNYLCKNCGKKTTVPLSEPPETTIPMRAELPKVKRYVVTAAQNATPVHKGTWKTLSRIARYYEAELVVIPGRYKNPTSQWTQKNKAHEWWAEDVLPYLCNGRIFLNNSLVLLGDVKIQWAARTPLIGMDAITQDKCGIVGHGSRGMRSIATPQHKHPKIMLTTGACTVPNYTDTKQGKIADFNHCFGGLIVEIDGNDVFYARQLNATRQGHIIDLDLEFTPDGERMAKPALSLTMGDIHQRWILPEVVRATFTGPDSIVKRLNPRYLLWHDVMDFHSRNHHHKDDWITKFGKWKARIECVRTEIEECVRFINKHTRQDQESVIVSSNHERAVGRWLRETDPRADPLNLEFWLDIAKETVSNIRISGGGIARDDPFINYAKKLAKKNVRFLKLGESFVLSGVEYGFHGDIGPNGARGTTKNLSTLGVKVTKGHSHVAEIVDGCYSAGKSSGMLEYEIGGPSNHTNAHVVQYANGKRAIIIIINGRYCLKQPRS